ncbi:MAG: amidohydrolase family protein [Pseudomonadales bacterium]|nr:amidohydrolase family protein [Pseudomonadales bacterium]
MNKPLSRLALAGLLACALCACQDKAAPAGAPGAAERVFLNGAIYTADAGQRSFPAMAISGDTILFVGGADAVGEWIGDETIVTDLQGKRVLPGLHDSHVHPVETIRIEKCDLQGEPLNLAGLADFVAACRQRMAIPDGEWLIVKNWNFSEGNTPADGLRTVRAALDRASADYPVLLENTDSHHFAANSAGLNEARNSNGERVGLSAATLAVYFSDLAPYIGLDAGGEPNGELHETAYQRLGVSRAELINLPALIPEAGQMPVWFNSRGITSLLDAAFYPELAPVYDSLVEQDALSLRVTLAQHYEPGDFANENGVVDMQAIMARARVTREKYAAVENIKADQLKFFVDGVLEGNPFSTPPGLPNGAQLKDFYQPIFELDSQSGELSLAGYVDPDSKACTALQARAQEPPGQSEIAEFVATNGFYPVQCRRSSGVTSQPVATIRRFLAAAIAEDFSVHFHAIGDRAVRVATDLIASVTPDTPATNRHSIAHAQLVDPNDVRRIAALKIPVVFTFSWAIRDFSYDSTVIPFVDRIDSLQDMYNPANYAIKQAYPARSILDAGGVLAAGSDAPVISDDPMPFENIEKAVTRNNGTGAFNPGEGIAILDAIDAYTINGARMMRQDDLTGSLAPGKKADFIIIDRDIIALAEQGKVDEVSSTSVLETWFNGNLVYRKAP